MIFVMFLSLNLLRGLLISWKWIQFSVLYSIFYCIRDYTYADLWR